MSHTIVNPADEAIVATVTSASIEETDVAIARAATAVASRLDPHRRLMVAPGTSTGNPASRAAIRATLRLSSPAWLAQPYKTSSNFAQSTPALRSMSALMGMAARSSVRTGDSAPP